MSVPVTIRCECGTATPAKLGDAVTCTCGRRYETGDVPPAGAATVRALQGRMKFYARLGMLAIVAAAIAGFLVQGWFGAALAAPAAGLVWFRLVQPRFKRKVELAVRELPSWQVTAQSPSDGPG